MNLPGADRLGARGAAWKLLGGERASGPRVPLGRSLPPGPLSVLAAPLVRSFRRCRHRAPRSLGLLPQHWTAPLRCRPPPPSLALALCAPPLYL